MRPVSHPFFAANWKMHNGPTDTTRFVATFEKLYSPRAEATVAFFPPAVSLAAFVAAAQGRADLEAGVQDVHTEREGAHTGAISASMAADVGAVWGLAGHSERRREFGDDDESVAHKVLRLLESGVRPILCVGETLEERDAGQLEEVLARQVQAVLQRLVPADRRELLFAYEPVWAIGTGRSARPADAAEAHGILRSRIAGYTDPEHAARVTILYGGSVKPSNIDSVLSTEGVDGVLVGGASLDPESFSAICAAGGRRSVDPPQPPL